MTYNGWTNYPTWVTALHIDNCPYTNEHWHGRAKDFAGEGSVSVHWTQEASARFRLADELKESITDSIPESVNGVYADLLGATLADVNWCEVADRLLSDIKANNDSECESEVERYGHAQLTGQELYDHENPAPLENPMDWEK
jgi:hypothetical protein|tara:strand:+ start:444 stop:869 length:426 start_codon:yes stop_codon:yes gene_type:complete